MLKYIEYNLLHLLKNDFLYLLRLTTKKKSPNYNLFNSEVGYEIEAFENLNNPFFFLHLKKKSISFFILKIARSIFQFFTS